MIKEIREILDKGEIIEEVECFEMDGTWEVSMDILQKIYSKGYSEGLGKGRKVKNG